MATPREQLAELLRKARIEAGYGSQGALAKRLNLSRPVISKAESPTAAIPSEALLTAWSGVTGTPLDELTELAGRCRSGTPEWFVPYVAAEAQATSLRCWSPMAVPGLLQTEAYALEMLSVEPYTPERLAELLRARLDRQKVLDRVRFTVVLDYSVVQRMMGSAQIMAEQCAHLVAMAERPNVSLHIVPPDTNTGIWCELNMATKGAVTTVCMTTLRDVTSNAPDLVDDAMSAFDRVLGCALPCAESLEFLRIQEEQWKERL